MQPNVAPATPTRAEEICSGTYRLRWIRRTPTNTPNWWPQNWCSFRSAPTPHVYRCIRAMCSQ